MSLALGLAGCGNQQATRPKSFNPTAGTRAQGANKVLPPGPGFDGSTLTVGVLTPQTGSAAVIGNPLTAGNAVYLQGLNSKGGVGGRYRVQLEVRDTQFQPQVALQAYNAVKGSVALFVQVFGTGITKALLPQLRADGLVGSPASLDASWIRDPNLLPVGAPYQIQSINALDYYMKEGGGAGKKVCALHMDDPYGDAGLQGLEFAAERLGFEVTVSAAFKQGDNDFTGALSRLQSGRCEAVLLTALPGETAKILSSAAQQRYAPRWIGQSSTWTSAFATSPLRDYLIEHFWLVSEGPSWGDESVEGMRKMLDDVRRYRPDQKPDLYFTFGYEQAWAVHQVLERAVADGDLSPSGISKASREVDTVSFGGLSGDYRYGSPAHRDPPRLSTIFRVDPSAPAALAAVKTNFSSDAARQFRFGP